MFGAKERSEADEANWGLAARTGVGPAVDGLGLHDGTVARAESVRLEPRYQRTKINKTHP